MKNGQKQNKALTKSDKNKRVLIRKFYRKENDKKQRIIFLKRTFAFSFITLLIFSIGSFFIYKSFYNHYESIVKNRIETGFWQSRAGIYAAPRVLRVGQKLQKNELIEILRKSGYVEGETGDTFWNGTYSAEGYSVEITTNELFRAKAESAQIEIRDGKIVKIRNGNDLRSSFKIRPEMLTGRSETKRAGFETLKYSQIPETLKKAIIVTEDRRFFEHRGIDPKGILRAAWANFSEQRIRQGGSTITQQLVKNTFLTNERTFQRKFSEAFLALALENLLSKEDILTLYCNEIYLGQYGISGIHGFGMASRAYFDKDIKDLNLAESATLAAIIRRPNHFAFGKNKQELKERRNLILDIMQTEGIIDLDEAEFAKSQQVVFTKPKVESDAIAPYFVDSVIRELPKQILLDDPEDDDNLRVYTTIDRDLQEIAEKTVEKHIFKLERQLAKKNLKPQATLIAMDPHTGEVLALVGGSDYSETQYNRATQAKRQPGSAFKPFVYATAIERGYLPNSLFADKKMDFDLDGDKTYEPANYGDSYSNKEITIKTALARSSNVVAVQAAIRSGLGKVSEKAEEFGFENVRPYPSIALGTIEVTPIQLATAYSSFANSGKKVQPTFIKKIVSGEGFTIFEAKPPYEKVISPKTAYMMTDMLEAVVERGTARSAKNILGKQIAFAGKTGSSKDAWFVGYTPNLVTVAWVGVDENVDIGLTGGEAALPLWTDFMKKVLDKRPELGGSAFKMPKGLVEVTVDPETGMQADHMCPVKEKVVLPIFSAPKFECFRHKKYPDYYVAQVAPLEDKIIEIEPIKIEETEISSDIQPKPVQKESSDELKQKIRQIENLTNLQKDLRTKNRVDKPLEPVGKTYTLENKDKLKTIDSKRVAEFSGFEN